MFYMRKSNLNTCPPVRGFSNGVFSNIERAHACRNLPPHAHVVLLIIEYEFPK